MKIKDFFRLAFLFPFLLAASQGLAQTGILILAHGTHSHGGGGHHPPQPSVWEKTVHEMVMAASARLEEPVELAFGMWNQKSFQSGVDRLTKKHSIENLLVLPLFVSDHSLVIRAQKYMFGLTDQNPLWFDPGKVILPASLAQVRYGKALGRSKQLSRILFDRTAELAKRPSQEEIYLIAHGPVSDEDDKLWLGDLDVHVSRVQKLVAETHGEAFANTHVFTVRDDADEEVQQAMTKKIRARIEATLMRENTPVVVPVLLAAGGIEKGILERLEGLEFRYSGKMIAPHDQLVEWIVNSVVLSHDFK